MAVNQKFRSFVEGMIEAAARISEINPDYVLAPMMGSVPFIDAMALVDQDFDPTKVMYMPASARIAGVNQVIERWYGNFLESIIALPDRFPTVLGIDEVVSGGSVVRCIRNIDRATDSRKKGLRQDLIERVHSLEQEVALGAIRDADLLTENLYATAFAQMRRRVTENPDEVSGRLGPNAKTNISKLDEILAQKLNYRTIGVEARKADNRRDKSYMDLRDQGRVLPVSVDSIVTMDRPEFCPAQLEVVNDGEDHYGRYGPKITGFQITPQYLHFLEGLADYVGADKKDIRPINMTRMLESAKFLESK